MTNRKKEIGQHFFAVFSVNNFGMKLQAVKSAFNIFNGRNRRVGGGSGDGKTIRQFTDGIAVAHPAWCLFFDACKQAFLFLNGKFGKAVFPLF